MSCERVSANCEHSSWKLLFFSRKSTVWRSNRHQTYLCIFPCKSQEFKRFFLLSENDFKFKWWFWWDFVQQYQFFDSLRLRAFFRTFTIAWKQSRENQLNFDHLSKRSITQNRITNLLVEFIYAILYIILYAPISSTKTFQQNSYENSKI